MKKQFKTNSIVIKYLSVWSGVLMKDGKRSKAEKFLLHVLFVLKQISLQVKGVPGNINLIVQKAIENAMPVVSTKTLKKSGRSVQVPVLVKSKRRVRCALVWITDTARANSRFKHNLAIAFAIELIRASRGLGGAIDKKIELHRKAYRQRAFSRGRV